MEGASILYFDFLKNAERHPHRHALSIGEKWWSYSEIEGKARKWAQALVSQSGGTPRRVGIFAYRTESAYIGTLASALSGAAFVPLNRTFPVNRTRSMIEQAELDAIIVDAESLRQLEEALAGLDRLPLILLPESNDAIPAGLVERGARILDSRALDQSIPLKEPVVVGRDSAAYLLFTSGSTGRPKGVPITHRNAKHFLEFNQKRYRVTPEDRLSQTFDLTFDLAVFDLFMAWNAGACLCVVSPLELLSPARFINDNMITIWFSVPSVATLLLTKNALKPESLPGLRLSLFCGEALPRKTAEAWQAAAHNSVLENLYGPTELTIACSVYRWDPERSGSECVNGVVPIGELYSGLTSKVILDGSREAPEGAAGELCVSGPQVFPGYLGDFEKTRPEIISSPGPDGTLLHFYRTGDMVQKIDSSYFVYLGRNDTQVKIMGYRVELGEVEAALRNLPGVVEAVALPWSQGIAAFISGGTLDGDEIRACLRRDLPAYMVPGKIERVDSFPLNVNGKIDRKYMIERLRAEETLAS